MEITDVIYGEIFVPADVAAIVATPQFQRLKSIKQLGNLKIDNHIEHEHHRYAHCLGTYHAASLMLDALERNTEWIRDNNNKIPPVYREAVELAALLHDIAHGPFSHAWEHVAEDYVHETEAFACIDYIFEEINQDLFPELREDNNFGIELIKALIDGKIDTFKHETKLPEKYEFIFEIVSNKRTKLDVDKWDYLKRDYSYLQDSCQPNMNFDDVFLKARVSECGTQIEYRYEDYDKIYNVFAARYEFHLNAYVLPEYILRDRILSLAIQEIKPKINNILVEDIRARNRKEFLQLTDTNVMKLIKNSKFYKFLQFETKFQLVDELPRKSISAGVNIEISTSASETKFQLVVEHAKKSISADVDIESAGKYMPKSISADINIESVAKYMPEVETFSFYGNRKNLPAILDATKKVRKTCTCCCDQGTKTVYYTVQHV